MRTEARAAAKTAGERPNFGRTSFLGVILFLAVLSGALYFTGRSLLGDIASSGDVIAQTAILILGAALLLALGFEFVNGFHDTANAVATVIYTRSLPPTVAVIWSGLWNFLGVILSAGLVAYSIIGLLPVELILQVGSSAGYAMIFALLAAAIIWNFGTWFVGIPNSSSHCLIGSVLGVGLANQLMAPAGYATSGVNWAKAEEIARSLLLSPLIGFVFAGALLLLLKLFARNPKLYVAPKGDTPPPWWIRSILVVTCTAVSFAHGGNDGQKGMGLIMLILIGAAPAAFALNRALPPTEIPAIIRALDETGGLAEAPAAGAPAPTIETAREALGEALRTKKWDKTGESEKSAALGALCRDLSKRLAAAGSIKNIAPEATAAFRSDFYVAGEAAKLLGKQPGVAPADADSLKLLTKEMEKTTRYIPDWVKVAVAFALGLGTMVGWRRIVVTVGEKIGKTHLTYAQGAAAETVAAATILTAQQLGLPVSTTHVLSSGVAGTMAANGSGLQWST
ncbi:MAG: inorganic phosphate transporter, partial [Parvularculaceae bacterium]|nr:inorganic phosphate transporter [Parvularculaceae bacterium]